MINTNGNNSFLDNHYDGDSWSAPILQMPEELTRFFSNTSIAGRRIQHIFSVGPAYNMSQEWMQNFAIALSQQEGDSDHYIPPLIEFIPPETVFSRLILVDHPIIIQFDTGDRLEVLFAHGGEVRVSINALPLSLEAANGARNVNLDLMFSEVIGQRISGIQVGRRKELPEDWEPPHGEDWKEQFVVWDNCWGTGNLTRDYHFGELYCSTLFQSELDMGVNYNPEATKFQFDFLNDYIPSPDDIVQYQSKIPQGLYEALKQDKPIVFFLNPPYATSRSNVRTKKALENPLYKDKKLNPTQRSSSILSTDIGNDLKYEIPTVTTLPFNEASGAFPFVEYQFIMPSVLS